MTFSHITSSLLSYFRAFLEVFLVPLPSEVTPIDAVVPPIGWEGEGEVTTTSNSIEDFNACGWDYLTNEDARKCLADREIAEQERRLLAELEKSLGDNQDEINELLWIDIVDASEGTDLDTDNLQLMLSELKGLGANPVIFNDFIRKLHIVVSQGGDFGEFSPAEFNLYLANVQRADFAQGPMFDAFNAMDASLNRSLKTMASINNVNNSMMQGLAILSYWESSLFGMDVPDAWGNTALGSFFLGQGLKQDGSVGSRLSALLLIDTILIAGAAGRVGFRAAASDIQLFSTISDDPIDPQLFAKMKSAFEKNGGVILQGDEVDAYLRFFNSEGVTDNAKQFSLLSNPTKAAVFEEFIHTAQHRTGRFGKYVDKYGNAEATRILEIEAAEKLIRNRSYYGISNEATLETITRLRDLRRQGPF